MYTTHITPPAGARKPPEYQMTQVGAWALTGSREQFRQGATAFRNGRDWAKERRDEFISTANEKIGPPPAEPLALESPSGSPPSDTPEKYLVKDSETSALTLTSTSLPYPVEEPKNSADELIFTWFSHLVNDEVLADELSFTTDAKPTAKNSNTKVHGGE